MSYSSQVTSVCPIHTGLISTSLSLPSLSLSVTLPAGSLTSVNCTTVLGIVILSVVVGSLSSASAPPVTQISASAAARLHMLVRHRLLFITLLIPLILAHHADADVSAVGQPAFALGVLRVVLLPGGDVLGVAVGVDVFCVVLERPAAGDAHAVRPNRPFRHVSQGIEEAPGIGFHLGNVVGFVLAIGRVPGDVF